MQVFAYKMCNFSKKVFQCPPNRVPSKSCDFSFFSCIYAKKSVSLHANLDKYGFFFGIVPT